MIFSPAFGQQITTGHGIGLLARNARNSAQARRNLAAALPAVGLGAVIKPAGIIVEQG